MHYALAKRGKEISDSLHKYVALAPCFMTAGVDNPEENLFRLHELGIYALYDSPTWEDDLNKICEEFDAAYCEE